MTLVKITQQQGLHAYAQAINTLRVDPLKPILADDFHYASQHVFEEIESGEAFVGYLEQKFRAIAQANARVFAEMGFVEAYGAHQPCVILAQNSKEHLVGLVLARVEGEKLKRLDLCMLPEPEMAERSGDYPQ